MKNKFELWHAWSIISLLGFSSTGHVITGIEKEEGGEAYFYISTTGSNRNPETREGPLAMPD